MKKALVCPKCGHETFRYLNPIPTADIIIRVGERVVLIKRRNAPLGWALPGGFIDYGESAEDAAIREAKEETSLDLSELRQFAVYSNPNRDPRHHTLTVVFTAQGIGIPSASDDAQELGLFSQGALPSPLVFDHAVILADYFRLGPPGARSCPSDG